jgi:hypothetical protein
VDAETELLNLKATLKEEAEALRKEIAAKFAQFEQEKEKLIEPALAVEVDQARVLVRVVQRPGGTTVMACGSLRSR